MEEEVKLAKKKGRKKGRKRGEKVKREGHVKRRNREGGGRGA